MNCSPGSDTRPGGRVSGPGAGRGRRSTGPGRDSQRAHRSAAARARGLAHGRRRAAARVTAGGYTAHPGLENWLPAGRVRDQATALRVVEALTATQRWRSDRRASWSAILRQLVCCVDWQTGLVTADKLGAAGARAPRTVSRVIAWAVEVGLVVIAEQPASAAFLGTTQGRTPTYAIYLPCHAESTRGTPLLVALLSSRRTAPTLCQVGPGRGRWEAA